MKEMTILSLGDLPAGEGVSAVLVSALGAFAALALIFLVLVVMNRIHEKNNPGGDEQEYEQKREENEETHNDADNE